jgi:hypothetical protein
LKMAFEDGSVRSACYDVGFPDQGEGWRDAATCLTLMAKAATLAEVHTARQLTVVPLRTRLGVGSSYSVERNLGQVQVRALSEGGQAMTVADGLAGMEDVTAVLVLALVCGEVVIGEKVLS